MPKIIIQHPDGTAAKFGLNQQVVTIGRAENNDIMLRDGSSSSYHAVLKLTDSGDFAVTDLDSTNGTKINGDRVQQRLLRNGDHVVFGDTKAFYESDVPARTFDDQVTQIYEKRQTPAALPDAAPPPPPGNTVLRPAVPVVRRSTQSSDGGCFALVALVIALPVAFFIGAAMRHSQDNKGEMIWEYLRDALMNKPHKSAEKQSSVVSLPSTLLDS